MTNPTSNFGWQMPTSTDLVTDLPADFETFGQAVDTSLADLKGGTTGQVLAKASNTNMDFTWVAQDDSNAIQNAIVDAKGDLIAASANDTPARLAVGNNGETLVADSSTSTGLRYQGSLAAGKNAIINGAFDIWQRGTSIAAASGLPYTADRWQLGATGTTGRTVSRQNTNDTTNLPFIQYCARVQRDSGNTGVGSVEFNMTLETAESIKYAGRTITLSFYARAGANYSTTSSTLTSFVVYGTGTDQNIFTGLTGQTNLSQTNTLTTTWQRFTQTVSIPATATQLALAYVRTPTGTAGANDYFEVTGVQLELGSVATTFSRAGGTIQGELAACQRYYYLNTSGVSGTIVAGGFAYDASTILAPNTLPTTMRTTPTLVATTGTNYYKVQGGGYVNNFNTLSLWGGTSTNVVYQNGSGTGLATTGHGLMILTNSTSSSVALSAEL